MEEKVNAVMLRAADYGENDKILTLFSLEKGVLTAKIRGVKKAGAKLKFAAEPFCFAEYVLAERQGRRTVAHAALLDGFYELRTDLDKFYAGAAVLEFVRAFCPENLPAEGVFLAAVQALKALSYGDEPPRHVLVRFLLSVLPEAGYAIRTDACADCGRQELSRAFFDFEEGVVYCSSCAPGRATEVSVHTVEALNALAPGGSGAAEEKYVGRALKLLSRYLAVKGGVNLRAIGELFAGE